MSRASAQIVPEFDWRPAIPVVVVALVLLVGERLPLPAMEGTAVDELLQYSPDAMGRISVFALGLRPLFSVLILFEILKLAFPGVGARIAATPEAGRTAWMAISALTLLLAAMQANEVYQALAFTSLGLVGDETLPMVAIVASLIAGVAVLLFVVERVRLPGLVLGGFWLASTLPAAENFLGGFVQSRELLEFGAIGASDVSILLAFVLAAAAAIVFCATALERQVRATGGDSAIWSPILLWPPFLAGSVANIVASFAYEFWASPSLRLFSGIWALSFAVVLPLTVFLYARSIGRAFPKDADWYGKRAVLTLLALVQVVTCAGLLLAADFFPAAFPLQQGSLLLALVIVLRAIWNSVRPTVDRA